MKRKNRGHVRSDPLRINDFFASNGSFYHPFPTAELPSLAPSESFKKRSYLRFQLFQQCQVLEGQFVTPTWWHYPLSYPSVARWQCLSSVSQKATGKSLLATVAVWCFSEMHNKPTNQPTNQPNKPNQPNQQEEAKARQSKAKRRAVVQKCRTTN